jgi:putative transcriptional regulator
MNKITGARYNMRMITSTYLNEQLLIAMPSLLDSVFERSVSLVCQHDADGAMGLVLNQGSEFTFDQLDLVCENATMRDVPVLSGGPVQPERGFVLHQDGGTWESSLHLSNGLTVSTSRDILQALAAGNGPKQYIVLLGYSGWSAGQLEQEIAENTRLSAPASNSIIFQAPIEQRWLAAARLLGVDLSLMATQAGHA